MFDELKTALPFEMGEIVEPPRLQIVERDHVCAVGDQTVDQVGPDKTCTAGYEYGLVGKSRHAGSLAALMARFVNVYRQFFRPVSGRVRSEDAQARRLPQRFRVLRR